MPSDIPILEWRKRLDIPPEDIVQQTLKNTTNFYLSVQEENCQYQRKHYRYTFPRLRHPRQRETFESETFLLHLNHHSVIIFKIIHGNYIIQVKCTPLGEGNSKLDRLKILVGVTPVLNTDNAKIELGETWKYQ